MVNLKQDRKQTSRVVLENNPEGKNIIKKYGHRRLDLSGYDTKFGKKLHFKHKIHKGIRGGLYYIVNGRKVYLNRQR